MIQFKFIEGECFKLKFPDSPELIFKANSIPGGRYMKKQDYWKFPLSVRIYKRLKEEFGIEHKELDRDLGQTYISHHENKPQSDPFGNHQKIAVCLALRDFGFKKVSLQATKTFGGFERPLLPRGFAFFMEMGTRKTSTAINVADTLHVNGYIKTAMIIVDLSVVDTWANPDPAAGELSRHSSVNFLTFTATGSKAIKEAAINSFNNFKFKGMKWLTINPEGIGRIVKKGRKNIYQYTEGIEEACPDLLIIDESTLVKNHATARGKLIDKLLYHTPYKIIMSGNPIPKGGHEVFGQYKIMDRGIYGDNFYKFRDKYFNIDFFNGIDSPKEDKEKEFQDLFHSGCFVARKAECLDLPPKTYEHVTYEMGPEQAKAYIEMRKHAITAMEDLSCSADVVITKYLRLSQIAGGFLPLEDANGKLIKVERFKQQPGLDILLSRIDLLPTAGEQFVVWARFQEEIKMISEKLTEVGISNVIFYGPVKTKDRVEAKRQFREKEVRAFVASDAASKGLNDLKGSTYAFYYSNSYKTESRQQSEDRQHRSGSTGDKITYIDVLARCKGEKTIDDEVLMVLQEDKDYSDHLLEIREQKRLASKFLI